MNARAMNEQSRNIAAASIIGSMLAVSNPQDPAGTWFRMTDEDRDRRTHEATLIADDVKRRQKELGL